MPWRASVGDVVSDAEAERSGARVRERQAKSERVPQPGLGWVGGWARGAERHAQAKKKGYTNVTTQQMYHDIEIDRNYIRYRQH